MIKIITKLGKVIKLDYEDAEMLKYRWYISDTGYATLSYHDKELQKTKHKKMHRLIMGEPNKLEVDHVNRDRLNNRRCNLRLVTSEQNKLNTSTVLNAKGVCFQRGKWRAYTTLKNRYYHIGVYDSEIEAKSAREAFMLSRWEK
jgi:uncharacterized protein YijF (DUF1287 family)